MAPLQIIGAGFGRTATDSLHEALNILGYNTHHMKCLFTDPEQNPDDFYNAVQHNSQTDWDRIYAKYDAAVDWPTCTFYKELMLKYPNAKVILTVRSANSWYESVKNTIHARHINPTYKGEKVQPYRRMMKAVLLDGVICDAEKFNKEEDVKQMFLDHIEEVKQHVPADKLYVMEIGEGWEGICKFLGKDTPDVPYPRVNSTVDFQKSMNSLQKNFAE
ncbi:hypothetical protein K501DRAFT_174993 [Backusella circina FSU 941]|nr:hypothetical protein K501DRAFT_174993 [Backusella circina FSU 941]